MKTRISVLLARAMLVSAMILPAGAAAPEVYRETQVISTEYGEIEVETTLVIYDSFFRSSTKRADKTQTYKYDGTEIATATLSATFGYDGSSSWVESASASHSTSGGWSYGSQSIAKSGGTATLTATLSHAALRPMPVNISMSCTSSGKIS